MKDLSRMVRKINFPFLPHRSSTYFQYVKICQTCNMNLSDPIQFFSVFRNHMSWNIYNTICKNSWDYAYFSNFLIRTQFHEFWLNFSFILAIPNTWIFKPQYIGMISALE